MHALLPPMNWKVPGSHTALLVWPERATYVPIPLRRHTVDPWSDANDPRMQLKQMGVSGSTEYEPGRQGRHDSDSWIRKVPGSQVAVFSHKHNAGNTTSNMVSIFWDWRGAIKSSSIFACQRGGEFNTQTNELIIFIFRVCKPPHGYSTPSMSPEQMFSLFAGFIAASFLIWLTSYLEYGSKKKSRQSHAEHEPHPHHPLPQRAGERAGTRIQENAWNVSTFFGLRH
jgi:hypothetical protein